MSNLIKNELLKQLLGGKKIYIFMAAIVFFNLLGVFELNFVDIEYTINAQNYSLYMLATVVLYVLPFYVILVMTDMITTEYVQGTLKDTLLHPVKRSSILASKLIALFILIVGFITFSLVTNYIFGVGFWGWGEQFVYEDPNYATGIVYSSTEGILRTIGGYYISVLPLTVFGLIVMYLGFLFKSSGVTVGASFGLFIILNAIGGMFEAVRPYLFVSYFRELASVVFFEATTYSIYVSFIVLGIYGVVGFAFSLKIFNNKDIFY
ncbi:hypothetical protein BKP35_05015 [Anaerobacillus arseniciselenatis]|uniref:ABC transporter permease n=1 Tax=Anaerobacillus arseniciselenatis TaxID=85682 RepID=A0A1S2LSL9_9BACI|nr:ABC transporter permease [Anaerobacillus arseniciselenatis]OIJ15210.1 hypothetical protein BKP35_05015 [Anaerobacillus arseniciselenatis]